MNILKASIYFFLSTVITTWFIAASPLYIGEHQMILSCSIAGAKWAIQIGAALIFLDAVKWEFIRRIGMVCLTGSCVLLPYCILSLPEQNLNATLFIGSLVVAVLVMIYLYYRTVIRMNLKLKWWLGWLFCLAIAVSLQLTIVFHVMAF